MPSVSVQMPSGGVRMPSAWNTQPVDSPISFICPIPTPTEGGEAGARRSGRWRSRPDRPRLNNTCERSRDCRRPIVRCNHDPATFHLPPFLSPAASARPGTSLEEERMLPLRWRPRE